MKVEWNRVTWYSKLIALVIFVVFPFMGFYWGVGYGEAVILASQEQAPPAAAGTDYYQATAEWQTGRNDQGGYSIAYPIDLEIDQNYSMKPSTDWRIGANGTPGSLFLTVTVPAAFEPQTNFSDARLTVGSSRNDAAIAQCFVSPDAAAPGASQSTTTINGITFAVFKSSDAGAGNYYETTSYRAVHAGQCYAIEYTVHSTQIGNYPPEYHLQPFDAGRITTLLDRMVGTFKFL
ncbi:MAG TPA: hypothetical protein VMT99_04130 [Candidatus Paceibacterota bacterium]|nr:hypothetical protein [Candidatus Paceibacterota bacterium]